MSRNTNTLSVVFRLKNDAGQTKALKLPIDFLRTRLKQLKEGEKGSLVVSHKGYEAIIPIQQVEEAILLTVLFETMHTVKIPKILEKVLVYEYDRYALIYNEPIEGRKKELDKLWSFMTSKTKTNCILVGQDGVGRTTIVKDFSRQLILADDDNPLKGFIILKVNLKDIPRNTLINKAFYLALRKFIKDNRDRVIFHFDFVEDLVNYPDMHETFLEEIVYRNTKVLGEVTPDSIVSGFFSIDMMRFLNFIPVQIPEYDETKALLAKRIKRFELENNITISDKMVRFAIMTGSILAASTVVNPELTIDVLNFAVMNAKINGQKAVTKQNILSFYNLNFKLMDKTEEKEKIITAYHEIGHYVVSKMVKNVTRSKNAFVSILPISSALGITASYDELGKQLTLTREYYLDQIACDYGGRTGEFLYTHMYSTGASADIESASDTAEMLVLSGGLAEDENISNQSYMWGGTVKEYLLTDEEKKKLNNEISKIRAEGFKRAQEICNENADLIAFLVDELLKDGILLGSELDELVKKFQENPIKPYVLKFGSAETEKK